MSDDEQFAVINTRDWYTAMRTQAGKVIAAMTANQFQVTGLISTKVSNIDVEFEIQGQDVHAMVGKKTNGEWMYDWKFPIGWLM